MSTEFDGPGKLHRGVILLSPGVYKDLHSPGVHDIGKSLLLPDNYVVEKIDGFTDVVKVYVASASIPDSSSFIAILKPVYFAINGQPRLERIEVVG